ncbi:MAG: glycosyltransferase family 2 protein, partial [bacterium]|nr:glycosyltransferase family 2 protein [bacterium]
MAVQSNPPSLEQGVSIVVPVYNEAENITPFLKELCHTTKALSYPAEIILVDDGSTDATSTLLPPASVKLIRHEINQGYGAAIKTGIHHSTHEALVIIDADGTYAAEDIPSLLKLLRQYEMVVGARLGVEAQIPWVRRPVKWIIGHFAAWMVRRRIPDLNSGLRAFRKSQVLPFIRLLPDGFSLTTTLTVALMTSGRRVFYHPIQYRKRGGKSKFRPISDTWNMILTILRTVVLIRPLNVFLPLSLILALLAVAVLVISKAMGHFMDATFIVLMTTSIQMFVLGLIADLIVR